MHIALEEAGCGYDAHRVVIANKENRAPAYLAVNPHGRVPALRIADERVTEWEGIDLDKGT